MMFGQYIFAHSLQGRTQKTQKRVAWTLYSSILEYTLFIFLRRTSIKIIQNFKAKGVICEMMFGDIHEHNTKQSSLGHKISFFSSFFFFVTTGFEMMFFDSGALARAKWSTLNNKIWLSMHPKNFGSDKIVCTTYVHYVHTLHVHPINVDNRERAKARNKRKIWKFYNGVGKWETL